MDCTDLLSYAPNRNIETLIEPVRPKTGYELLDERIEKIEKEINELLSRCTEIEANYRKLRAMMEEW